MYSFVADLRYACRRLLNGGTPVLVVIVSIAVGIGASTTIFGAVDRILFAPLPYPEPDRVVMLSDVEAGGGRLDVAYGTFIEVARRSRSFESLAVADHWQPALTASGEPERLAGDRVSADYFRVLGVGPFRGRDFTAADDLDGAPRVAIVSDGLAMRRFGLPGIAGPGRRMAMVDSLMLSRNHRICIVRCDGTEHVIVTAPQGATLLSSAPAKQIPPGAAP